MTEELKEAIEELVDLGERLSEVRHRIYVMTDYAVIHKEMFNLLRDITDGVYSKEEAVEAIEKYLTENEKEM